MISERLHAIRIVAHRNEAGMSPTTQFGHEMQSAMARRAIYSRHSRTSERHHPRHIHHLLHSRNDNAERIADDGSCVHLAF
jgi:hypothetical protein